MSTQTISPQEILDMQKKLAKVQQNSIHQEFPEEERGTKCKLHFLPYSTPEKKIEYKLVVFEKLVINKTYYQNGVKISDQVMKIIFAPSKKGEKFIEQELPLKDYISNITKKRGGKSKNTVSLEKGTLETMGIKDKDITFGEKEIYKKIVLEDGLGVDIKRKPNVLNEFWNVEFEGKKYNVHYRAIN